MGRLGGHHSELLVVISMMALNHSLQLKALRQRGSREANYSPYHVSPQAAQKPTEAAGDLRWFLDLIIQVSRDMTWSLPFIPKPHFTKISSQDHKLNNTGVLKVPQEQLIISCISQCMKFFRTKTVIY